MYLGTIDNTPTYRKYLWLFFLVAIGFCVFIFDYALSRVTIKIYPQNITQTIKMTLTLDQKAMSSSHEKKLFVAKIAEKELLAEASFKTTGIKKEDGFAQGKILIESKREKDIPLPKGYKIIYGEGPVQGQPYKDKIVFALDEAVTIPAGGSITATVTAVNKGARGDVQPGRMYFASMAQWNRERLLPHSIEPFTGGIKETKLIATEDIAYAKDELLKKAKQHAIAQLCNQPSQDTSCKEDLTYIYLDDFSTSQPIGEAVETFSAKIRGRAKTFLLPAKDIRESLSKKVAQEFSTADLISIDDTSLKISVLSMDIEKGQAEIEASIAGIFAPRFSTEIFEKKDLIGFNETAIKQKYSTNPAIKKVEAKFFPFWRKTVPSLEDHIFIEIVK